MPAKTSPKPVRLKDLAERLDLAVSTVSMAMSDYDSISIRTKERVRRTAEELGYKPNRNRRDANRQFVGFWAFGAEAQKEGYATLTFRLSEALSGEQKRLEVRSFPEIPELGEFEELLGEGGMADQLLVCGRVPHEHLELLADGNSHCCLLGHVTHPTGYPERLPMPCVSWREEEIGSAAVRVLLERGYRKIGCFCEKLYPGMSQARFVNGYRLALMEAGVIPDHEWVVEGGAQYVRGEEALNSMLDGENVPEAYVAPTARAVSFLQQTLRKRDEEVPDRAICFWDANGKWVEYGLTHCCRLQTDPSTMASMALHLSSNPQPFAGGMLVSLPFEIVEAGES